MNQIPDIRGLNVKASDRIAVLEWNVTDPISRTPCVLEVWKDSYDQPPFFGTYAGELTEIDTYHGQDADTADTSIRHGVHRMIAIGHSVPLTPATQYFYRLQCAGDARHGTFTTMPQMDGMTDHTISRVAEDPAVTSMDLEYGTSYSRSTDSIGHRGTAIVRCAAGETCSVSFPASRGLLIYFRWHERDKSGAVIRSSGLSTLIAQ
jgi:hypothetical protein